MLGPRTFAVRGPSAFVRTIVELIDDVDGKSKAEETVLFSLDGVEYRSTCRPRTPASSVARSSSGPAPLAKSAGPRWGKAKTTARTAADKQRTAAIHEWAQNNGYNVSSHGRIQRHHPPDDRGRPATRIQISRSGPHHREDIDKAMRPIR